MILNELASKTTNSFKMNNIKVDLNIKEMNNYNEYELTNIDINKSINNNLTSKIGLNVDKYIDINIDINDRKDISKIIYDFNDTDTLYDKFNININNDINELIIIYKGSNALHYGVFNINIKDNINANITFINLLKDSTNLIAIESYVNDNAKLNINYFDLYGNTRINNYYSEVGNNSISNFNNIYIGINNDLMDNNYYIKNIGLSSESNMNIEGVLNDKSEKHLKGTIDFVSGAKKSIGHEKENCILLSDNAISKSLPILLCGEENVIGTHGVSTGKIDENKVFYLMSRGFSKTDAIKLLIETNFNKVINNVTDEETIKLIRDNINI